MGGWIALLIARAHPGKVAGLVTIAAAPDFTEDSMWAGFTEAERRALETEGFVAQPSDYSDEPYIITRRMIEDGRNRLVLRSPLRIDGPVRLLQGSADTDVLPAVALRLFDHLGGDDIRLTLVKGADHRFSTPDCLALIRAALEEVLAKC
jgi:pimeloyl-ACP methyl ester carboxylesterase